MTKLFAVYLGGRAPKANTELHDMAFAVGETIEDTYTQLLDKWFGELHATGFYIATTPEEAKKRAKTTLLKGTQTIHKDDLHDVDDCIALDRVNGFAVTLTHTGEVSNRKPNNGYHVVPKDVIAAYIARQTAERRQL